VARGGAVDEDEDLVVALVPHLERRAGMDDDDAARLDVHPLAGLAEQHGQPAAQRDEDLLLIRVEVPAAARVGRVAPHPRTRLGHLCGLSEPGRMPRLLAFVARPLLPIEVLRVHDVPAHCATIPSAAMAEPRPAALPPAERTVGQLVAETVRFYGDHFWQVLPLGLVLLALDTANLHRSVLVQTLILWAFAPAFSAAYVWAAGLVHEKPWFWPAFGAALLVFLPFPVLVRLYLLPGLVWFALFGLAVPAAVAERLGVWSALSRGWQLARADLVHAIAGVITLALVYFVTRYALLVTIHQFGDQSQTAAGTIADLVLSPLVFIGPALLYVDQAARVE
jgi:hypothetical protein